MNLTQQDIKDAGLSDTHFQRLTNKAKGGRSNQKGNHYELYFAVYQLALGYVEWLKNGRNTQMAEQILSFVDDFWTKDDTGREQFFQLKNVQAPSWTQDIKADFIAQEKINKSKNIKGVLYLVNSNEEKVSTLIQNIPGGLKATSIMYFAPDKKTSSILTSFDAFKQAFEAICARPNPLLSDLDMLVWAIIKHWTNNGSSEVDVENFFQELADQHQAEVYLKQPGIILPNNWQQAKRILDKIPDYTYTVDTGYFMSEYKKGLETFAFSYAVNHDCFAKFLSMVISREPNSYDELEDFMYV